MTCTVTFDRRSSESKVTKPKRMANMIFRAAYLMRYKQAVILPVASFARLLGRPSRLLCGLLYPILIVPRNRNIECLKAVISS